MQLKPPDVPDAAATAKGGMGATAQALADATRGGWVAPTTAPQRLSDVAATAAAQADRRTALPGITGREVGRVLGGGVVPGSLVLFGGEPGIGKSTLLMQLALMLAHPGDTGLRVCLHTYAHTHMRRWGGRVCCTVHTSAQHLLKYMHP